MSYKFPTANEIIKMTPRYILLAFDRDNDLLDYYDFKYIRRGTFKAQAIRLRLSFTGAVWDKYPHNAKQFARAYLLGESDVWDNRLRDTEIRNRTFKKSNDKHARNLTKKGGDSNATD